MKNCLLLLVGLLLSFVALSQTNYYSKSTGNLQLVATWGTNTDGTGTAPTNFTTASSIYNIRNRATATISGAWTVSGTGSKVIVGDGTNACNFTIPSTSAFTGTADVSAAATLTILNTTVPTLGTLAASSTVVFGASAGAQSIPAKTYGNLTLSNNSGTQTAAGAIVINGALVTTSGGTFALAANQLTGSLTSVTNNGTITTTSTANPAIPSGKTWTGTTGVVTFARATGGQFIPEGTYKTLTCSNTSGTNTANGNLTISGTFTTSSTGGTLNLGTNTFTAGSVVNNGTLQTQNTSSTPLPSGLTWVGTVEYNGTGAQTLVNGTFINLALSGNHSAANITLENGTINVSGNFLVTATNVGGYNTGTNTFVYTGNTSNTVGGITYNNLALSNTSLTKTAGGNITVNGTLTTTSGGTFALGANQLTGSLTSVTNNGTITTTSTANPAIPSGKTWSGTTGVVTFAGATGGQFIPEGTYKTLTCSNTSGTNTANGNLTITGTFTTSALGGTFNLGTNTFTAGSVVNNGTLQTQNTTATPLPSGLTWGGIVDYSAATGGQTIVNGTYSGLRFSNTSGTNTATNNLVVNTSLAVVNTAATLDLSTFTLGGTLTTISNNGTISTSNTTATPIPAGKTWGGTGTVRYDVTSGGQTLVSGTYARLSFLNTSGTNTAAAAVTVNTSLTTTAGGTLNMSTFALGGTLSTISNNGTISTSNISATPFTTGKTWGGTGTVKYAVTTGGQTIMAGTYNNNLELSNTSGTNTASGVLTTNATLTVPAGGTLNMVTFALAGTGVPAVSGTIRTQSATIPALPASKTWGGTIVFDAASGLQYIPAGTFNNLTLGFTTGFQDAQGVLTVNGALVTTSGGTLRMGANQLLGSLTTVTNNGTITTTSTANPAIPSGKNWSGTTGLVTFASTTGGQFIPAGTYKTLTCSNTSGTNTATGNLTVSGTFTTSSLGGTMNMVTNTFTAGSVVNTGTLQTQNTSATPLPSGLTWAGTVDCNATTGGQTIVAGTYATLRLSNTSGTNTASGNLVVNNFLNVVNAGSTLNLSTFTLGGTLTTITNNGIIATSNTSATPIVSGKTWGGTIRYDVANGAQTLVSGTYAGLSFLNTSGTNTASGAVTVNTSLTTTAGGTLNMSSFALGGTLTTVTNNGVLATSNISGSPLPSGITWGGTGTVKYAVTTGAQTIMAGTYNNLELSNTSGTNIASGDITTNGTLTVPAGGILNMSTRALLGTVVPAVSGTIRTQTLTNPALPASKTWGGTVLFDRTLGAQFLPAGTFNNLTCSNTSGNQTAQGALTVNGALVTTSGGILVMGANQLLGSLTSVTNNGTITTTCTINPAIPSGKNWTGTTGLVTFAASTGGQFIPAGTYTTLTSGNTSGINTATGNLTVAATFTTSVAGGTLNLVTNTISAATISNNGTLATQNTSPAPLPTGKIWGGTVNYDASTGGQTIMAGTYATLRLSNTSGTNTASGNLVVNTLLNVVNAGSTLNMSTFALGGTLSTVTNNGIIATSNTSPTPLSSGVTWGGTGTVRYAATTGTQTIMSGTYNNNLELSNTSGTNTASGTITTNGTLTVPAGGTLNMVTNALAGSGVPAMSGTIRTQSTNNPALPASKTWGGTVIFDATAGAQNIPAGTFNNLTLSNTSGTQSAQGALTINGALVTTSGGTLVMGANQLLGSLTSLTNNGTITTTSTVNPAIPTGQNWTGTTGLVTFANTAGGQFVPAGTYKSLTCGNTSGTNTATGNLAVSGTFTTSSSGGTLDMVTNTFTATSVINNGTLATQNTSTTPLPTGRTWGGTVNYNAATGGQTIMAGTYATLRLSNASGTNTASGNLVVNTLLNLVNAGSLLDMSTFTLSGTLNTVTNNGVIATSNTTPTPIPSGITWGGTGTVKYAVTTGGQTIMSGVYNNLELSNTSGTNTASNTIITNGTLTTLAGGTLNMSTFVLSGAGVPAVSGTIRTQNINNPPLPASKTWGGTIIFDRAIGAQSIPAGTFNNLTLSNTSGTQTAQGALTVNGALVTTGGGIMAMGANQLLGSLISVTNNGTITTTSTVNPAIPSGKTWDGIVNFINTTGGQNIPSGTFNNLALSNNSGTQTAQGALTVNGSFATTSGGTLQMGANQLLGSLASLANNGTITTTCTVNPAIPSGKTWTGATGLITFAATTGGQFIPAGTYTTLTCSNTSGTNTATGNLAISGAFTTTALGGTLNMVTNTFTAGSVVNNGTLQTQNTSSTPLPSGLTWAGTVDYNATTGGQTIVAATTYNNLRFGNTSGTNTASGNIVVNGNLTTGTGTSVFDLSTFTLSGTLTAISGGGTLKTQSTSATPFKVSQTWPQTVEYNRAAGGQTIVAGTYNGGFTNSNTSGVNTVAGTATVTVNGALTLSASSNLSDNSRPIIVNGNIAGTGTHTSVTTGGISMTGAGSTISSVTLGNLTLNNAAGFGLSGNPQINGTLTFTSGNLDIANNNLTFGPSAPAVAGTPASTKMIVTSGTGEVRKRYSGLGSFTFPIGDATPNYSPFTVNLTGGTPGGSAYVGVRVDDIKHPNNASTTDYLNRFWAVNVSDVTSPQYSISGNYVDADIVGDEADIATASYGGSLPWVNLGAVNAAANTISASGLSGTNIAYSGFTSLPPTVTVTPTSTALCSGDTVEFNASGNGNPSLTYTWAPATGLSATTGASVLAAPTASGVPSVIVYTVTITDGNGITATANTTLTVNPSPTVSAGSDVVICNGLSTDLVATDSGVVTYSWSPATALSATTGATVTANPSSTITYTLTGTAGNGCTNSASITVTVNPSPVVDTITGTLGVCKGSTTTLSSLTSGGVWTSSNTSVATIGTTGIVTGVDTGTATISYTVTNGFGCVTRVTKVVTVNPLPVISSAGGIFTTCENKDLELSASLPSGTWTSSNTSVANIDTFTGIVTPVTVGTALMSYQVTATGCMSTREITMIEAPTAISGVTALCPGGTATLTCTYPGGTWSAFNPAVISVNPTTGAIAAVIVAHFGHSETEIRYTIPNGCFRVVHPTVNAIPAPIYGGVTSLCFGETTTFLSGSLGNTWSSNNTGIATITSGGVITAQAPGVATISYTSSNGCANTRTLTVNPALSPSVGTATLCTGTTTLFSNAATGGTWTSSNISKASVNLTSGLVSAANAGTTTLSYRAPSGCYVTNVITVNTTPSLITGTRSVCIAATTTLGSTPSGGTWSSSASGIASVGSTSGVVSGVASGTSILTYTSSGCTRTAEVTVNVLPAAISGAGVTCAAGGTTALTNASGTWTSSNTSIATVNFLGTVTGVNSGNAIITFRNANNCITTKEVTINPLPSAIVVPTGLCLGSTGTFTATPAGGTWASLSPSVFSVNSESGAMTALIANYTSNSLGTVRYTLPTGCVRTGAVTVNVQPGNIYGGTGKVCTGATTTQLSSATSCTWSSATPSVATISSAGVVTGVSVGNTVISYTSAAGCAATRVITVNATPNAITGATTVLVGQTTTLANTISGGTWSSSVPSRATIGSASGVVTGMSAGTSNITYMMSTGCFVTRAMNVAAAKGVSETVKEIVVTEVKLYPNPTTGVFNVSTPIAGTISVYTIDGRELLQQQVTSGISSISLPNNIAAGLYTCRFMGTDGGITIIRLVYEPR